MAMKILLFGKNGQVGWELQRSLSSLISSDQFIALNSDSQQFCGNFTDLEGVRQTLRAVKPDIIINAAAYTTVDRAEQEQQLAHTVNADAPAVLAEEAKRLNSWLIHYSTDYVFDGSGDQPRLETDATQPLNVYGQTKLAGERRILATGCKHIILRTSWVYSARGNNFIKTVLRLAQERDQLQIVDDQIGAPTGAKLIADVTVQIVQSIRNLENSVAVSGLYHLTAQGQTSWHGLAHFILTQALEANITLKTSCANLYPIASTDYPVQAQRPLNSRLDTTKIQQTFNLDLPEWQCGVLQVLTELFNLTSSKK